MLRAFIGDAVGKDSRCLQSRRVCTGILRVGFGTLSARCNQGGGNIEVFNPITPT